MGEKDWSRGFFAPYYRVFQYSRDNLNSLGHLSLFRLIVFALLFITTIILCILYYIFRIFAAFFFYFILIISILFVSVSPTVGLVVLIILMIILVVVYFLILSIFILMIVALGSVSMGSEIYTARKILDIRMGEKLKIGYILEGLKSDWKLYLMKGLRLYLLILFISIFFALLLVLAILLLVGIVLGIIYLIGEIEIIGATIFFIYPIIFLLYIVFYLFALVVSPIIQYVVDWTAIFMAEGKGALESLREAVSLLFRKKKLAFKYWLGYIVITLISSMIYPLSMIMSFILPIASKLFLLINENES